MTGTIPFARESWVAVNLYSMPTDGRQTLTLDGEPPLDYSPDRTVDYVDRPANQQMQKSSSRERR